jgi:hypothetical protein
MKDGGELGRRCPAQFHRNAKRVAQRQQLTLAQAISGSNPLVLSKVMSQDSPRTDVRLGRRVTHVVTRPLAEGEQGGVQRFAACG